MTIRSTFLILFLIFNAACGSTTQFSAPEIQRDITIDGTLSDWDISESLLDARDDANFYTSYDDEFLYLFVDIRSPFKDRAMKQSGFIVYLSDDKDLRKKIGIGFPSGSFNLLREYPNQYNSFLRESDWFSKPANRELLEQLEEEVFERVMIVERPDGKSNPEYGFVELSQLQVDGIEIAVDRNRRYISIELKVPRDGSSLYGFKSNRVWLGLAIETPNFRLQNDNDYTTTRQDRRTGMYGGRQQPRAPSRSNMARNLGEFEQWYRINLED